jgi:hypothetical protein
MKHTIFKNKPFNRSAYWFFDLKKDNVSMDKYEQMAKMTNSQQIKLISSKIYDDVLLLMFRKMVKYINSKEYITFPEYERLLEYYQSRFLSFPTDSLLLNELNYIVYHLKYKKTKSIYDKKEDIFSGLYGNVIKLPDSPAIKKMKYPIISLREIKEEKVEQLEKSEATKYNAICQHLLSWEKMSAVRKKNPNKFNQMLFEFINQYVIENVESDYVCKSCGTQINLKNFVNDGAYDDSGRYITFSMPMEIPLEEIPEYEKYKITIRNLEKIIDRIASIANVTYFLEHGNKKEAKSRKRGLIKDVIDLLLIHNKNLKNIYKSRNDKVASLYNVNKDLSNLFVFELENSIFVYSSKDKDYYKSIKQNNVLIYILLLMLLELNDSQVIFMRGDKLCNFYFFEKYGYALFKDLKIRKNNKGDIDDIQQYKTLCYLIYYLSCMVTKYNMWYTETEKKTKK